MLAKILERIAQNGGFTTQSLAREMGVSKELMEAMLADLVRAGYLQTNEPCETKACSHCRTAAPCAPIIKSWKVVKKL